MEIEKFSQIDLYEQKYYLNLDPDRLSSSLSTVIILFRRELKKAPMELQRIVICIINNFQYNI